MWCNYCPRTVTLDSGAMADKQQMKSVFCVFVSDGDLSLWPTGQQKAAPVWLFNLPDCRNLNNKNMNNNDILCLKVSVAPIE